MSSVLLRPLSLRLHWRIVLAIASGVMLALAFPPVGG